MGDGCSDERWKLADVDAKLYFHGRTSHVQVSLASVPTTSTHLRVAVQTATIRIWHRESVRGHTHALHTEDAEKGKQRVDDALEDRNKERGDTCARGAAFFLRLTRWLG